MKINWGTGIAIFLTFFIGMLFLALYKSLSIDRSLVRDDYYHEDIHYQKKYSKKKNALQAAQLPISINRNTQLLEIDFASYDNAKGSIHFYRPSDASLDRKKAIVLQESKFSESISTLKRGKWRIKIDFVHDGIDYYVEKELYL